MSCKQQYSLLRKPGSIYTGSIPRPEKLMNINSISSHKIYILSSGIKKNPYPVKSWTTGEVMGSSNIVVDNVGLGVF